MTQLVKYMPGKHRDLCVISNSHKGMLVMVAHICYPSVGGMGTRGSLQVFSLPA